MSFQPVWLPQAHEQYKKIRDTALAAEKARVARGEPKSSKAEGLFKQVHKTVTQLFNNPRHPGLQTHEYHDVAHPYDSRQKVFEAYAQNRTPGAYRVFWCYGPGKNQITIIAITPHP
jgi:hypothetical protein